MPVGDGHTGDGFSLYEEYRGFSVNGRRLEGDPTRKELFIRAETAALAMPAIARFAAVSGLRIYPDLRADELAPDRVMNFNATGTYRRVPQHAVVVRVIPDDRSYAIAVGGPGTPQQVEAVEIPLDVFVLKGLAAAKDSLVVHELAHAANVYHHGESDPKGRRYRVVDGVVYESEAEDTSLTADGKVAVTLFNEDGTAFPLASVDPTKTAYVGDRHGQHSGEEDCAMRYATARFHQRDDPSQRFLNATREVAGTQLCTTDQGTGVNAPKYSPEPRYLGAAAGLGKCQEQVCVNDAHLHPAR